MITCSASRSSNGDTSLEMMNNQMSSMNNQNPNKKAAARSLSKDQIRVNPKIDKSPNDS